MSLAYKPSQLVQFAKRREQMQRLRSEGWTLERIGKRYGITRARVGQLLAERRNGART